ncbi:hypothetical protein TNCV_157891 [Trichonephila clavipes]|nr:hypothetical protein TNCV_157891 [Trichonephila clavipes]
MCHKSIRALKCLAEARWGCSGGTLIQTYYTFILPLLTYCRQLTYCHQLTYCRQPLVVAGKNVLHTLEKIQNQSLCVVAGAVKATLINSMFMVTDDKLLRTIIQEKALILWEKVIKAPGWFSLWNEDT